LGLVVDPDRLYGNDVATVRSTPGHCECIRVFSVARRRMNVKMGLINQLVVERLWSKGGSPIQAVISCQIQSSVDLRNLQVLLFEASKVASLISFDYFISWRGGTCPCSWYCRCSGDCHRADAEAGAHEWLLVCLYLLLLTFP